MLVLEGINTLWEKGEKVGKLDLQEGQRSERFVIVERSAGPLREAQLTEAEEKRFNTLTEAKGKKVLLTLEGVFQRADTSNANNRIYPDSIWKKVLEGGSKWLKSIQDGDMMGESDHPKDGDTLLRRVACMVTDLRRCTEDKKAILGRVVIFDTAAGRDLKGIHDGGGRLGVSSRGQGSVVRMDGKDVVQEDFELQTWDVVYNPSTPGAYPNEMTEGTRNCAYCKCGYHFTGADHGKEKCPGCGENAPKGITETYNPSTPGAYPNEMTEGFTEAISSPQSSPQTVTERSSDWNEIVLAMAETPVDSNAPLHEAMSRVRNAYRAKMGVTGPLTEQERAALSFYVETSSQGSATAGTGNHTARITFGGGLTESLGTLTLKAKTSEGLRQMVETRLGEVPSFVTVEYDRAEAIYEECATRFNSLLEVQVEKAQAEGATVAESTLSAKLAAAKQLLQQSGMRIAESEATLEEKESEVALAEQLIEGMAAEFFAEGLKSVISAIAATHPNLEGLPMALCQADSLSEAVAITKEMKAATQVFLEREPLPIRERRVHDALSKSKQALIETNKSVEKREAPELTTTKSVIGTMTERGIGK